VKRADRALPPDPHPPLACACLERSEVFSTSNKNTKQIQRRVGRGYTRFDMTVPELLASLCKKRSDVRRIFGLEEIDLVFRKNLEKVLICKLLASDGLQLGQSNLGGVQVHCCHSGTLDEIVEHIASCKKHAGNYKLLVLRLTGHFADANIWANTLL
jgi:hypothetical protein